MTKCCNSQYHDSKGAQTYIVVYLHYSCIKIYKRNLTESSLLQYTLFILIYYGPCSALVILP